MAAATTLAWVGLAVAAGGTALSVVQQQRAAAAQRAARDDQKRSNATQSAQQGAQFAQERRQQIREERVRRSQILQQAEQSGASGGSGEMGALAGMASNLNTNMGMNQASLLAGQQIGGFQQSAANHMTKAQSRQNQGQMWSSVAGVGSSLFGAAGGWGTIFSSPQAASAGGGGMGFMFNSNRGMAD